MRGTVFRVWSSEKKILLLSKVDMSYRHSIEVNEIHIAITRIVTLYLLTFFTVEETEETVI